MLVSAALADTPTDFGLGWGVGLYLLDTTPMPWWARGEMLVYWPFLAALLVGAAFAR